MQTPFTQPLGAEPHLSSKCSRWFTVIHSRRSQIPVVFWKPYCVIVCIFRCLNIFRRLPWFACRMHTVRVWHYPIFCIWKWRCTEVESFTQGSTRERSHWVGAKNHLPRRLSWMVSAVEAQDNAVSNVPWAVFPLFCLHSSYWPLV